jgi:hypothetical protein
MKINLRIQIVTLGLLSVLLIACSQSHENENEINSKNQVKQDNAVELLNLGDISSFIAERRLIKTANFKLEVNNLSESTFNIEKFTSSLGGTVLKSDIRTEVINRKKQKLNREQALDIIQFEMHNKMILSVPAYLFDSLLNNINALETFIHQRNIIAEDVRWNMLSEFKTQKRTVKQQERLDKLTKQSVNNEVNLQSVEKSFAYEKMGDDADINLMKMNDQIEHSLIFLDLIQPTSQKQNLVQNIEIPGIAFHQQAGFALNNGLEMLKDLVVFLLRYWNIWLIALLGFYAYKKLI